MSDYQRSLDDGDPDSHKLTTQTVRYWSDFNRVFYHPRSIVQINDYELGSSLMPFEKWENGEALFMSMDRDVDLLDRDVRVWAEECDQMQGIQVYTVGDDAWGGFASRYVERLRDEFGKMALWTWGVEEEKGKGQKAKQLLRSLNAAKTIQELSVHSSMYIPLSLPAAQLPRYVQLDRSSQWHVTALLSAALESMTLPSRTRPGGQKRGLLGDLEAALNVNGNQRIAELQCSIIVDPMGELPRGLPIHGSEDGRVPSNIQHTMIEEDGLEAVQTGFDINLSSSDRTTSAPPANKQRALDHVFGAVEEVRGKGKEEAQKEQLDEDEESYAQKRRRFAGLPVVERFVNIALAVDGSKKDSGTNLRWSIHFLIAFPAYSRSEQTKLQLRYTPHYQQHPRYPSGSKHCKSWPVRWPITMSVKTFPMGLVRSAKLTRRDGRVGLRTTVMTDKKLEVFQRLGLPTGE